MYYIYYIIATDVWLTVHRQTTRNNPTPPSSTSGTVEIKICTRARNTDKEKERKTTLTTMESYRTEPPELIFFRISTQSRYDCCTIVQKLYYRIQYKKR